MFKTKLANKNLYQVTIKNIKVRLQKLSKSNLKAQKLMLKDCHKQVQEVFYLQGFFLYIRLFTLS